MPRIAAPLVLATLVALAGCGSGTEEPADASGEAGTLTVYLSTPSRGDSASRAAAVAAGTRLALDDAGGRAGESQVRLVELDSSKPGGSGWDPGAVAANAERAADDPTTIAYLGELDFGGSAISLPITNAARILQVSPLDGLTSLTRRGPAGGRTGPERYYPSGRRSFVRLTPIDLLQAGALVEWARDLGAQSVAAVSDQSLFGRELAAQVAVVARCAGLSAEPPIEIDGGLATKEVVEPLEASAPDAIVYAGGAKSGAAPLFAALERKVPKARLLATGGAANLAAGGGDFGGGPKLGALRRATLTTKVARPPSTYPHRGERVLRRLSGGRGDAEAGSEGLYGYEAMRLVLDAVEGADATGAGRSQVARRALDQERRRSSVLGAYRIDAFGDTNETRFGGYRTTASSHAFSGIKRSRVELAPASAKGQESSSPCAALSTLQTHGATTPGRPR